MMLSFTAGTFQSKVPGVEGIALSSLQTELAVGPLADVSHIQLSHSKVSSPRSGR